MFIMATMTYPTTSAIELGKAAVENLKKPLNHATMVSAHVTYGVETLQRQQCFDLLGGQDLDGSGHHVLVLPD